MLDELRPYLPPGVSPSPETDDFELASASYYSVPSKLDRPVPPAVRDAWAETRGLASGVDPDLLFKKAVELARTEDWVGAWKALRAANVAEPRNPFLEERFRQIDELLRQKGGRR